MKRTWRQLPVYYRYCNDELCVTMTTLDNLDAVETTLSHWENVKIITNRIKHGTWTISPVNIVLLRGSRIYNFNHGQRNDFIHPGLDALVLVSCLCLLVGSHVIPLFYEDCKNRELKENVCNYYADLWKFVCFNVLSFFHDHFLSHKENYQ